MRKLYITIILIIAACANLYAQKETNVWYFGYNTGLTFNTTQTIVDPTLGAVDDLPTLLHDGPIFTSEGCFSLSDKNGNLILASEGRTVYNKNLQQMANGDGLLGHSSATQSGIVIPMPGNSSKYYIITAPCETDRRKNPTTGAPARLQSYRYTTVDISLEGGLGRVIDKNAVLPLPTGYYAQDASENITVVGHANGIDYWLVSRMRDKWVVWAVTSSGISTPDTYDAYFDLTPGAYNPAPTIEGYPLNYGMGAVKYSPDGKTIAHGDYVDGRLSIANFNPRTGIISNAKHYTTNVGRLYGVEFSPN